MDSKSKLVDTLKHLSESIGLIHDNHGVIESLDRQKKTADSNAIQILDDQIGSAKKILETNQTKALELLDQICLLAKEIGEDISRDSQKLDSDFKAHKNNPDLIQIQKDIKKIQSALK